PGVTTVTGSTSDRAGNTSSTSASITVTVSNLADVRLLTLATGGTNTLQTSGNGQLNVAGTAAVDSTNSKAMAVTPNARAAASKVLINGSGGCNGCKTSNPTPMPVSGPYVPDPYATLTAPSTVGMPVYSDGVYHGPGVYATTLNITANTPLTIASGI